MKITFLAPHTRVSGGIKTIFSLATGLANAGYTVDVIATKIKDPVMAWYPHKKINFNLHDSRKIGGNLKKRLYINCDCIINFGDGPEVSQAKGKRILYFQGFVTENGKLERRNLRRNYDCVVVTSEWLYETAVASGAKHVVRIPPGLDSLFKRMDVAENRVPVIGGLYHTLPTKNFGMFTDTVCKLFATHKIKLQALVLSSSIVPRIDDFEYYNIPYSIITNPPIGMLPYVYSSCNLWLSTSKSEGFGLTNLEAMACHCPVVWQHNGGLQEYMQHAENCMVVSNVDEAITSVQTVFSNRDLREKLKDNGRKLASRFTWKNSVELFTELITNLVKK